MPFTGASQASGDITAKVLDLTFFKTYSERGMQ